MDYMTLATVIEDLETLRSVNDVDRLIVKYEDKMDYIEEQMSLEYEMDDGA